VLGIGTECVVDAEIRRQSPRGPFEVGDDEELVRHRETEPVAGQDHWSHALNRASVIDRLQDVVGARGAIGIAGPRESSGGSDDARIGATPKAGRE